MWTLYTVLDPASILLDAVQTRRRRYFASTVATTPAFTGWMWLVVFGSRCSILILQRLGWTCGSPCAEPLSSNNRTGRLCFCSTSISERSNRTKKIPRHPCLAVRMVVRSKILFTAFSKRAWSTSTSNHHQRILFHFHHNYNRQKKLGVVCPSCFLSLPMRPVTSLEADEKTGQALQHSTHLVWHKWQSSERGKIIYQICRTCQLRLILRAHVYILCHGAVDIMWSIHSRMFTAAAQTMARFCLLQLGACKLLCAPMLRWSEHRSHFVHLSNHKALIRDLVLYIFAVSRTRRSSWSFA